MDCPTLPFLEPRLGELVQRVGRRRSRKNHDRVDLPQKPPIFQLGGGLIDVPTPQEPASGGNDGSFQRWDQAAEPGALDGG